MHGKYTPINHEEGEGREISRSIETASLETPQGNLTLESLHWENQ